MTTDIQTHDGDMIAALANRAGMPREKYWQVIKQTVIADSKATTEQTLAFLAVAARYGLDPLTREIYAFPARGGGIQTIVSVDGWARLINEHPAMDGLEFEDHLDDDGQLVAVTCRIWRKDRSHPITCTEYMAECRRGTEPWKRWPARMLRHKALIQCARYAFGLAGIVDPDEAERWQDAASDRDAKLAQLRQADAEAEPDGDVIDAEAIEETKTATEETEAHSDDEN